MNWNHLEKRLLKFGGAKFNSIKSVLQWLEEKKMEWFKDFQYRDAGEYTDRRSETRGILLVIFTLITAVTFQAVVNPPGGIWQDTEAGHVAGRAIFSSDTKAYYVFLIFNTLAFSTSIMVIMSITYKFPFHFEIIFATVSMAVTYGSAIFAVTPYESVSFRYVLVAAASPFAIRLVVIPIFGVICRPSVQS